MNVENMYDAWDNGDRHEIRQQFARREEIIKLLQRDGAWDYFDLEGDSVGILMLVTLCQDVAAAEREACCSAEVINAANIYGGDLPHQVVAKYQAAIRARGDKA